MNGDETARILSILARSDEEALGFFHVRARAAGQAPIELLAWWRGALEQLACRLVSGDIAALEAWRAALEAAGAAASPAAAEADPDGTAFMSSVDHLGAAARASTPFSGASASHPPPPLPLAPHPEAGETLEIAAVPASVGRAAPRPAGGGAVAGQPASVDQLSVERYAALVAHTEHTSAERRGDIHRLYGVVDETHREQLDEHMRAALASDEPLRRFFEQSVERWRRWFSDAGGGRDGR